MSGPRGPGFKSRAPDKTLIQRPKHIGSLTSVRSHRLEIGMSHCWTRERDLNQPRLVSRRGPVIGIENRRPRRSPTKEAR
jgi:hypothetical protein